MGTWEVTPNNDGVSIGTTSPVEIYLPKNTGTTDIEYTITYKDDDGCTAKTTYTVPSGSACQEQEGEEEKEEECNNPMLYITPTDTTTNIAVTTCLEYDYNQIAVERCHLDNSDIGKTLKATGYFTAEGTCPAFGPENVTVYRDFSSIDVRACSISKNGYNFTTSLSDSELKVSGGDLYIEISDAFKARIKGESEKDGDSYWEFTPYSGLNDYYGIIITIGNIDVYTKIDCKKVPLAHTIGLINEFSIHIQF